MPGRHPRGQTVNTKPYLLVAAGLLGLAVLFGALPCCVGGMVLVAGKPRPRTELVHWEEMTSEEREVAVRDPRNQIRFPDGDYKGGRGEGVVYGSTNKALVNRSTYVLNGPDALPLMGIGLVFGLAFLLPAILLGALGLGSRSPRHPEADAPRAQPAAPGQLPQ